MRTIPQRISGKAKRNESVHEALSFLGLCKDQGEKIKLLVIRKLGKTTYYNVKNIMQNKGIL